MTAIILAVLQIFLLLLKAHFNREDDQEKAVQAVREAQSKLSELAEKFEERVRYTNPSLEQVDKVQDQMDQERTRNDQK